MKLGFHAAFWVAAALVCGAVKAGTVSVAGPASAPPGGVLTVSISLSSDLNNVYAMQGALRYDPAALTPLPDQTPSAPQGFWAGALEPFAGETIPRDADLFRMNTTQPGLVIFGYVKNPSNPAGSPSSSVPGTALTLNFSVAAGAAGATTLSLAPYTVNEQTLPAILLGAADGSPIEAATDAGLTVSLGTARKAGDANGDGRVTVEDVLLMVQAASGMACSPAPNPEAADVWPAGAPDGRVTLEDAFRTLRFLNGLETGLS